jgi:uncharacterized protein YdhG (YjbR/CyaY superfamily)
LWRRDLATKMSATTGSRREDETMASGDEGFTKEERAAMKARAAELRAEAKRQKSADKAAADLQTVLDAFAAMPEEERVVAEGLHALVAEHAPMLAPKTWYGFPSYADADGKVVMFFQPGSKFGGRYSTLGFQDAAQLDDGDMWPTSYALSSVDDTTSPVIVALLRKATGQVD